MDNDASTAPLLYVVIASNHNVAELLAVRALKPAKVVVIGSRAVTKPHDKLSSALRGVLQEQGGDVLPTGQDSLRLGGDHYGETLAWVHDVLAPALDAARVEGHRCILNATGGTKALVLALRDGFDWDEVHYKSRGQVAMEVISLGQGSTSLRLPDIEPRDQLRLYVHDVFKPMSTKKLDFDIAEGLLDDLWQQYGDLGSPHRRLMELLGACVDTIDPNADIIPEAIEVADPALLDWARRVFAVDTTETYTVTDSQIVVLKGGRSRIRKARSGRFFDWLVGTWYERYAAKTIQERLPDARVDHSVQYRMGADDKPHEADLLVSYKHKLYVVEIKLGEQIYRRGDDIYNTLAVVADDLGLTEPAFLTTPDFGRSTEGARVRRALQQRAGARNVPIFDDPKELVDWMGGNAAKS